MICKECNESDVLKINKMENVKFICKNGHVWFEEYIDNGGTHERPSSYKIKLEDTLFLNEKKLYKEVLEEIKRNHQFFITSTPEEITSYLIDICKFDKEEVYKLFKKITHFNDKKSF